MAPVGILVTIDEAMHSVRRRVIGCVFREAIWLAVIVVLVAGGAVFAVIAIYQSLLTIWEPWLAALATAGGALILALLVAWSRTQMRKTPARPVAEPVDIIDRLGDDLSDLSEAAQAAALDQYRKDPAGTLVGAVAVGAIIGLLRQRK